MTANVEARGGAARKRLLQDLPVEERRVNVRGMATSVLEGGQGRPVVLLHGGIQAGGLVWRRVLPGLVQSRRVVVPDVPGFGESAMGTGRLDASLVVAWLEELIGETCRDEPILVAHSAPAAFAARFAIERSDRIRQVVLVDPGGLGRAGLPSPALLVAAFRSTARPNDRTFERFMRRVMRDLDRVRAEDGRWSTFVEYVAARGALPTVKRSMRAAAKAGLMGTIPEDELGRIEAPVSLMWGRHDPLTPLAIGERLGGALGWPLRVIEDAGHLPHLERPDAFLSALEAVAASA